MSFFRIEVCKAETQVTSRLVVSQSVNLFWYKASPGAHEQILVLRHDSYSPYRLDASALTRGRVCPFLEVSRYQP
jgi:hypothetical protein